MAERLYVATRKGLFTYAREGAHWRAATAPAFLGDPVTAVLHDQRDGALYAALSLGHFGAKLHRSDDEGATWEELPHPAFAATDAPDAPSVEMTWTLAAGGPDEPGALWAGVIPGALFRSEDRGASWRLVEALWDRPERADWMGGGFDDPGLHTILVDPRDSARLTVAVSTGGVWRSDDRGATWRLGGAGLRTDYTPPDQEQVPNLQVVHRLAAPAAAPETVWCQHHNGIFLSRDGGDSFEEFKDVKPAAFGFAVAVHPHDPNTAWFAPGVKDECRVPVDARLVVNKTADGGKTFKPQSDGLPQEAAYDLIYRHALDVDETGEQLAMGSTTGNLWISEDGGAAWRQISAYLPPIAQTRFA